MPPRPAARIVVILPEKRKSLRPLVTGISLLLSLGLMGYTVTVLQKPVSVTPIIMPSLRVESLEPLPPKPAPSPSFAAIAPEPVPKGVAQIPVAAVPLPPHEQSLPPQPLEILLPTSNAETLEQEASNIAANKVVQLRESPETAAVDISPAGEKDGHDLLAEAHTALAAGGYGQALDLYNQILASDERNHDALAGTAYAYAQNGDIGKAIAANQRLLKSYPHDDAAEANLAHLLSLSGRDEDAITYLERAVHDAPHHLPYFFDLATLYDQCGHRAAALNAYRQVLVKAERGRVTDLPLPAIRLRVLYLERLDSSNPSTTSPADER